MEKPALVVTITIDVDVGGARRLVGRRTRPDARNGGRTGFLQIRRSRPIRDGESPEQAAADSIAFADPGGSGRHLQWLIEGPGDTGLDCSSAEYADGGSFYRSVMRPTKQELFERARMELAEASTPEARNKFVEQFVVPMERTPAGPAHKHVPAGGAGTVQRQIAGACVDPVCALVGWMFRRQSQRGA